MPPRLAPAVVALSLLLPGALSAGELRQLGADHCVSGIETGLLAQGGIATDRHATSLEVVFCDGKRASLSLSDNELNVRPLPDESDPHSGERPAGEAVPLPDGEITLGPAGQQRAELIGPTSRYRHAILGDAIEASGFSLLYGEGRRASFELDKGSVFEDLRVRLIDLSGDGEAELVAIRSYLDGGAALAVYGLRDGKIVSLGETPAIGLSNRWLNPAGAADFDGDGDLEIAYVETPHIGGTLRFFSLTEQGLVEEQAIHGFSNHAIGSRVLDMAAVLDWNGDGLPDLAIPDASRSRLQIVSLAGGKAQVIDSLPKAVGRYEERITSAVVASDLNADGTPEVIYALGNGSLIVERP